MSQRHLNKPSETIDIQVTSAQGSFVSQKRRFQLNFSTEYYNYNSLMVYMATNLKEWAIIPNLRDNFAIKNACRVYTNRCNICCTSVKVSVCVSSVSL